MKISIHFGLNRLDPAAYGGWDGALAGCRNDATRLAGLASQRGFDAEVFLDASATRCALRTELEEAADTLERGDTFLFTYAGHGGQVPCSADVETDGTDETFCLYDGELLDNHLREILGQFRRGVHVIGLLDSCHSGGMNRGLRGSSRVRAMPRHIARVIQRPSPIRCDADINASVAILTACRESEYASDGADNGAFTTCLLNTWRTWPTLSWERWFERASSFCARRFPQQHPTAAKLGADSVWTSKAL